MSKIIVTGGAGYLGSVLVPQLLNLGHSVTVIDNFKHGVPSLSLCSNNPLFSLINENVCNSSAVISSALKNADAVIPLAALVGAPTCDKNPTEALSTNTQAIKDLVRACPENTLIIFPNSNSGYGTTPGGTVCDETTPLKPISVYGSTKQQAEDAVMKHPSGICLRFATLFGASPRMRLDLLVNDFVYKAVSEKTIVLFESHFRRNFLNVQDAAQAIIFCLNNAHRTKGEVFNVGDSSANLTKKELCERIKLYCPHLEVYESSFGKDPDQRDYVVSNAKFEKLGWRVRLSLDAGIIELLTCYQQPFYSLQNRNN